MYMEPTSQPNLTARQEPHDFTLILLFFNNRLTLLAHLSNTLAPQLLIIIAMATHVTIQPLEAVLPHGLAASTAGGKR